MSADLEIGIHRWDADSYTIELRSNVPGETTGRHWLSREPVRLPIDRLRALSAVTQQYGAALWDGLLADRRIRSGYAAAVARTLSGQQASDGPALRVRLHISPRVPELHSLRWEAMFDSTNGLWVASDQQVVLSRYGMSADERTVRAAPADPRRMKVVLAVANPSGLEADQPNGRTLSPVDVAGEVGRARRALAGIDPGGIAELSQNQPRRPTLGNLLAELRQGCDLLYLVAHGAIRENESRLWLEDDAGGVAVVAGRLLLEGLRELPILPRLIVLASCQSAGRGREARAADGGALAALGPCLVEGGVPAVLAMQGDVFMDTVAHFMPAFFAEVLRTGVIDQAAASARTAARNARREDWWAPVLFHRLRDGRLWGQPACEARAEAPDDLAAELRKYLRGLAERVAELSPLFPERLRTSSAGGTRFDQLRQQVRVLPDRSALPQALAAEREQLRARGLDPDALAYTPGRGRADREDGEDRRKAVEKAVPRVWDEQAAAAFRRAVILADPGFGKTWLLRHEARRVACQALERLDQASPEAVEVPFFCRRLSDLARTDGDLDQDLVQLAGTGRSEGFRKWLRGRFESDRCVILLDALDEVPEERPDYGGSVQFLPRFRQRLRQRIEAFSGAFSRPRLLLTSRVVGYAGSPIPEAEELELMPFGQEETEAFVAVWFGEGQKAQPFLDHLRQSPAIRGLARIPLMLLLLCRSFEGENQLPSRRVDLYRRCLRGLLGEWKGEKQARPVGAAEIDPLLDVLGGVACALFQDGFEQFREDELLRRIGPWQQENPRHPCSRHDPGQLLQEFQQSGVLVRSGDDSESPWLFLHRTFREYLTARTLAQRAKGQGWTALEGLIDRKCWLPEWREVVVLLAGELADPEPLLALLCDEKKDDRFRHRLALAAHCLPELVAAAQTRCASWIDRITEGLVLLWWRARGDGTQAAVEHVATAFPSLKPAGRVEGRRILDWFLEKMQGNMRRAAVEGVGRLGPAAATREVLAGLLPLLDVRHFAVRPTAARVLGGLGPAAATREVLAGLLALLNDPGEVVRRTAAEAVGRLGPAATREVLAGLLPLLSDPDAAVQWTAADCLGGFFSQGLRIFGEEEQLHGRWVNDIAAEESP
jgi:hypothetical protein